MEVINCRNVNDGFIKALDKIETEHIVLESRAGEVMEFPTPVTTVYKNPTERVLFEEIRDANPFFHFMESVWMLAGRNDLEYVVNYNKRMSEYSDDGVTLHGAYGYRWIKHFTFDQLDIIVKRLKDNPDDIVKKIKKAKTDTDPITENIQDYENRPEAYNLLSIYSDLSDQKIETTINEFVGKDFSSLKIKLSEKLVETISPIGKNIAKLMKDKKHLEDVLKKGKQKASIIAEENLKKIREIVGFV